MKSAACGRTLAVAIPYPWERERRLKRQGSPKKGFVLKSRRRYCSWMFRCHFFFGGRGRIRGLVFVTCAHDPPKRVYQFRSGRAQFVVMMKSELAQHLLALRSKRQQDFAAIILGPRAMDKSSTFEPVHQFDGAVMADLHAVC